MKDKLKVNDVYEFRYKDEIVQSQSYLYHCFDGTLVVKKRTNGELYFRDTYWSSGDSRSFTVEEAMEKGNLTFLCNLDDVDEIDKYQMDYYDDSDIKIMHIHAGYQNKYFLKKGAERSQSKMLEVLKNRISDQKQKLKSTENYLKNLNEMLEKVKGGDISIYL